MNISMIQEDVTMEDSDYKKFEEKRWVGREQQLVFRHRVAYELLVQTKSNSFLDIGCGDGTFEAFVKKNNESIQCTGIDLSSSAIKNAKNRMLPVDFLTVDVTSKGIPFSDETFDTIIALDVLEHQFAPQDLLQEMKRVTKKYIIIGVPNFSSFPARLQMLFGFIPENNRPKKGHVYWFNRKTLLKLVKDGGFTIKEVRMNYQLERYFLLGSIFGFLTKAFPGLFSLSFVLLAEKIE